MASERLQVILELVTGNYKREAKEAATATGGIGNAAKSVAGSVGAMLGPAAIGGAIFALGKFAMAAGENADRLFDLQAQTGLSTDALQEWEFVAASAGAESEVFSDAVKAIIKNLSEAANGTGAAAKAYEALGVSVKDANGNLREGGEITAEVFDKLAGMTNITERNALAQDIFGKKWEETISILDLGTVALGNLRNKAKGSIISQETLRNADRFRETMDELKVSVEAAATKGLAVFLPLLIDIAQELEQSAGLFGEASEFFDELGRAIGGSSDEAETARQAYDDAHGALAFLGFGVEDTLKLFGLLGDELKENRLDTEAATEAHDSWMTSQSRFPTMVGPTIALIDSQARSFRNAARDADKQRVAMINLFNAQADLLDPLANVLRLQKENAEAQKRLTEAQTNGKTPAADLALAVIEAEQAFLRLQSAGAALTSDQIQAFAQLLVTQFGYSEAQVLDTLEAMNLLDGWSGSATFTLNMAVTNLEDAIRATGGRLGINNDDIQVRQHGGPVRGGMPYLVGERGPEIMVPSGSGTILPNGWRGGGSTTIVVQSPMGEFRSDLQYAALIASVTNLVEGS